MAASWLFEVMLSGLCCCIGGGTATAYGSNEVLYRPVRCCCQTLFGRLEVPNQGAASHSVAECRGMTCAACESYGCFRGLDSRQFTRRRQQLEGSEKLITKLVLPCPGVLPGCNSQSSVPSWADAYDKGAALSAAERCVSLQRFLL